jgi:hypothetical protein
MMVEAFIPRRRLTIDEWSAALDQSDADIAAGNLVPGEVVHKAIQDRIDRLEAALSAERLRRAAPRR